jgi:SAM-dependent methyltransferase
VRARLRLRSRLGKGPAPEPPARERLGRSVEPVSRIFGQERGRPVDRFYIERFLHEHRADVRGRVLELYEDTYTRRFGGAAVTASDVLHAAPGHAPATLVGDLRTGEGIPETAFDCFICTQTLHLVFEVADAVAGTRRALAPGGVCLATLPGMSQVSREDRRDWGDFWRFTTDSVQRLFADAYGAEHVEVRAHGNVLTASAFLYGLAAEELEAAELDHDDPDVEFLMTVRAVRPA